jgi:hypothetical protein
MGASASHSSSKSQTGPAFEKQRSQYGTALFNQGQGIFGEVNPTLQGMLNNPVTPQEQSALTQNAMQPISSSYDAAALNAAQRAARTRNPAGLLSLDESLAQKKGEGLSGAAENALLAGTKTADTRRQQALQSLGQLYGIDQETLSRLLSGQQGTSSSSSWGGGFKLA